MRPIFSTGNEKQSRLLKPALGGEREREKRRMYRQDKNYIRSTNIPIHNIVNISCHIDPETLNVPFYFSPTFIGSNEIKFST